MTGYHIDLLELGRFSWAPGFEIFWMEPNAPAEPLSIVSLLVRDENHTVLVNTGPDPAMLPTLNEAWAAFDPRHQLVVTEEQQLANALATHGVSPSDVDLVIVTPFQPYAIGNLLSMDRATYALSRRGWIDFHAPRWRVHPHDNRAFCVPEPTLVRLVTDKWPHVRLVEDEQELLPGLQCFWTGAHHRSSMAVVIDTDEGRVAASDCFFRYENVTENRPLGINESMEETLIAYERLRAESDILIPLYDPRVFTRHPHGIGSSSGGPASHL